MRTKLTPAFVLNAQPPAIGDRVVYWDDALPCFGLMVTKKGHKSFVVQYRARGVSRRLTLKTESRGGLSLDKARREAKAVIGKAVKGEDVLAERQKEERAAAAERQKEERAAANTLESIAEEYLSREGRKLRTAHERKKTFKRLVYPKLGAKQISDVKRSDIVRLLDDIEDNSGAHMAHITLGYIRKVMNWHAARSDDFRSPIVRGMGRIKPKEHRRDRTLTDDEIRAIWKAIEDSPNVFGRFVQFSLLTATRRNEAARMRWSEVSGSDWVIPSERYKTGLELLVPLSPMAAKVLQKTPHRSGFVFTHDGTKALASFSKFKPKLDEASGVKNWRLHDLRRTARTLLSRAGISADHAELCLGHLLPAMRATYDKHDYEGEKRRAFEALASLIERIVNPQSNVVQLRDGGLPDADRKADVAQQSA